jgi:hypothetical protein
MSGEVADPQAPGSDEDGCCSEQESEAEDPEWMSFATPDAGGLVANFEELWYRDAQDDFEEVEVERCPANGSRETAGMPSELTSEAIWQLVDARVQQQIARALEEAELSRPEMAPRLQRALLRRGQAAPVARRPKRGERGELVAEMARQGAAAASSRAQNSELLRPISERLGSAKEHAGRLAREARAVVAARANGRINSAAANRICRSSMCQEDSDTEPRVFTPNRALVEAEARGREDSTKAKTKVVDAANAVRTKLISRMPKGFQRRLKESDSCEFKTP